MARSDGEDGASEAIAFLVPGDIDQLSGGYGYDRAVIAEWRRAGLAVDHVELPGDFPFPSEETLSETRRVLEGLGPTRPVLIDGLAFGALPAEIAAACTGPVTVLLHHPLGLETGLSETESRRLLEIEKVALAVARRVVVTSEETARTVRCLFDIDTERLSVALPGTLPRARAQRQAEPPLIASIGSIIPRKGHADLVHALARLAALDWRLVIAGSEAASPDTVRTLKRTIEDSGVGDRIEIAGPLRDAALDRLFSDASLFALPSYYEGYGMVFAEALASGLPIVGYRAGAVPDVVPEAAGLLVEPGDIDALAAALATLLREPGTAQAMADAAWAAGETLPRWAETAERIHAVLTGKRPS